MGKQTHNQGKKDNLLYRSVRAGRLTPDKHPLAAKLIADRQPIIDWMNAISRALFSPNPLLKRPQSVQKQAKQASKESPWFSGYAQNFACAVGTTVSNVETQLRRRILHRLMNCDREAPRKRIPRRYRNDPHNAPPVQRYLNVPLSIQDVVTAADFAAVKALTGFVQGQDCEEDFADHAEELAASPKAKTPGVWAALCADARQAMLAAEKSYALAYPDCTNPKRRDQALASAMWDVLVGGHGMDAVQAAIVVDICLRSFKAYSCPEFGKVGPRATDTFILRVELDARAYDETALRNTPAAFRDRVAAAMDKAWEQGKNAFSFCLDILDFRNRQRDKKPAVALPVRIPRKVWDATLQGERWLASNPPKAPDVRNIALEIGAKHVDVRLNISQERRTPDIAKTRLSQVHKLTDADYQAIVDASRKYRTALGRDTGFVNTVSYGAVEIDGEGIAVAALKASTALRTPRQCLQHIETHVHPCVPLKDENGKDVLLHHNAKNYLDCLAQYAEDIDEQTSHIDFAYMKKDTLKKLLVKPLGLQGVDDLVPEMYRPRADGTHQVHPNGLVQKLIVRFFANLDEIKRLKAARHELYRKSAAVKRCWLGWLSTQEANLALRGDSLVVRERSTYKAIPTDNPRYRGPTFNRLSGWAGRGDVEDIFSDKLAWLGVLELQVPGAQTSKADCRASTATLTKRDRERFIDASGVEWHADEHAGLNVAVWLLLKPKKDSQEGQKTVDPPDTG